MTGIMKQERNEEARKKRGDRNGVCSKRNEEIGQELGNKKGNEETGKR
jgi:hypothetical protein